MNNPNNSREKLYARLKDDGYDLVDFDTFSKKLDEESSRKSLYDQMTSAGYDLGGYDEYTRKIVGSPFKQNNSVAPTPSEKPEEEKVQLSFTTPQKPQLQSLQVEQKEYPTIAETTQKKMAEGVAQRQQLSDMTTSVHRSLNRRGAELDEAQKANTQSYIPQGTAGSIPAFDAGRMYDPEYRDYAAAKESLQKAQAIIDAAGKEAEDKEKGHTGLGGFFKGAQRGFDESVIDWNTWTAGLKDTSEGLAILKALDAAEEGTLTESQQALLDAKAIEIATSQAYSSSLGRGYKAGQVTAESIPFMIEFALNPIARTGNTVAKKFARYALDRFGKEAAKKNVGKYVAGKALAQVATDALKAGAITATTGAGRTAADALQRMQGDIYYQPNEEGKVAFWKREGGEDATTAFKKAYANTTIENFSEMLGNYFAPIGKVAGVGVSKGLSKIGLEGVNQMLRDVKANDLAQLVADFEKRAQWNGTIGEFGEEVAGNILNSIIVGDQTLDAQEGTGVFNKENLIDTYLGVALLGGGLSAAKTIDYPLYKYYSQKAIKNAQLDFDDAFGKDEQVAKINEALTSDDPRIAGEALRNIIGNDTYTQDQQMSAAILAKTVQKYKGAKLFDEKMRNDPETPVEKVEVADSYDKGRNIATPQEKNDALNDLEAQEANIREQLIRYGYDSDADIDEYLGSNPIGKAQEIRNEGDLELADSILGYMNAKAVYDGMTDGINERIATTIEESDRLIDSHINKDDNLIHAAILKGVDDNSDRKVYIISGAFARNEDGTIDTTDLAEGASMIVMDATSGKKEFIDPRNLKAIAEGINPTVAKQRAAETITNEIATKEEAEIAGTLAFVPNDIYTIADENGVEHTATIVADTQDGNVQVIIDNAQEPMLMPKEKVQQMADAYNIGRANAKIAEKKAQSTVGQSSSEVKPTIPMDEQGKPIYEQAPVEATWAELLSLNDGNAEEAIDTAKIMRDNAKKALDKANKAASAKGDTVEAIQQAKAERKALIDAAQAKYDYWDNVANYQASQPQEVAEPTTAEEQTPIVENESFDENINEVEQVYNEESNERSTENTDVPTSVPAEDGIADGDQTSIEMVQGAGTDNTLGDRGSVEAGQGSDESNVGEGVADVPTADVFRAEEVDATTPQLSAKEDMRRKPLRARAKMWEAKVGVKVNLIERYEDITSVNAINQVDIANERKQFVGGWYENGQVYIYLPHTINKSELDKTYIHEVVAHHGMKELLTEKGYEEFCLRVWDEVMSEEDRNKFINYAEVKGNKAKAADEYIARLSEDVDFKPSIWHKIARIFRSAVQQVLGEKVNLKQEDIVDLLRDSYTNLATTSMTDAAAKSGKSPISFNVKTEEELQQKIRDFSKTREGKRTGWTTKQVESIIEESNALINALDKALRGNDFYEAFADREPTIRVDWRDGEAKPTVTWTRANIEYKYDMSGDLLCVNNEGIESVLTSPEMVEIMKALPVQTEFDKAKNKSYDISMISQDYLDLYDVLREKGFVVPCKGCFDAAVRFKMLPSVAQKFASDVNDIVDERNKNPEKFDAELRAKAGAATTIDGLPTTAKTQRDAIKLGVAGDNLTEHIDWTDLISAEGQGKILANNGGIFRAWQRTGAGRPKDKMLPEPYYGDIVSQTSTIIGKYGEKTPSFRDTYVNQGTGLRRNSHSEFRPVLAVDEIQFLRDAFIRNLTVFKYLKELDDVRLTREMGVKSNMSFFPEHVKGTKVSGLDIDGNYIASEESVGAREFPYTGEDGKTHYDGMKGWEEAQKLANKDASLSSVVFSIPHLIKALTDVPTPSNKEGIWGSLIPFHSSGATTTQLAAQGLGIARANGVGHGFDEAFYDYGKGVTNFEDVQNDRFGDGWVILEGKKAGQEVASEHKIEFANGTHYYNAALGVHLFSNGYVLDSEMSEEDRGNISTEDMKTKYRHPFVVDYNDKVREIGTPYAYKEAADYYIGMLPSLGLMPRFSFEVSSDIFLQMCADANVDPRHPKLGWKGEGNAWNPIDAESYYSLFCDYGMTDPTTGEWSPHRPVGYINENGEREFRLPDNTIEIVKSGLDRYTDIRKKEEGMMGDAIKAFADKMVERGRLTEAQVEEILPSTSFRFIGEVGASNLDKAEEATTRLDNLAIAREMEAADKSAKTIKMATGWERGADGKWRYEVDDVKLKDLGWVKGRKDITLEDIIDDESLFTAYPTMRKMSVKRGDAYYGGVYSRQKKEIRLDIGGLKQDLKLDGHFSDRNLKILKSVIVHEIQHAIQNEEHFAFGANASTPDPRNKEGVVKVREALADVKKAKGALRNKEIAVSAYNEIVSRYNDLVSRYKIGDDVKLIAGEVEARNADRRKHMTVEERRNSLASDTEDVSRKDQIFIEEELGKANAQFRISDYDRQFADLQSEYDALDKDDEKALNEWREKKKGVTLSYMKATADDLNYPIKDFRVIAGEEDMRNFYEEVVKFFNEEMDYKKFAQMIMKPAAFYIKDMEIIGCHTDRFPNVERKAYVALFHEQTHYVNGRLFSDEQLADVWGEAVRNDKIENTERIARKYGDNPSNNGDEYLAYTAQRYAHHNIREDFESYIKGEDGVSLDTFMRSANKSLPLRNQALIEILKYYRNGYNKRRHSRNVEESHKGLRSGNGENQRDIRTERGGIRGGVLDSLLNDVAQKGLREMVGEDAYNAFLMRAMRDLDEPTRRAIMENGMRNGLNFHDAAEEYLASLAEQDNVDEAYLSKVNALAKDMLMNAGIEVGDISNNELRYMLWRSHLQYDGIFSLAEDVVMRSKLGVGNYTQEADVRPRYTDSEAKETSFRIREQEPPKNTGIGYKVFVLKDGKLYPPMVANPDGAETPVGVWLDADAAPISGTSKTGRSQVKAGGKGTQGGSGSLAYRPGWHLGSIPYALQFNRKNPDTGERELFPNNFVWAEVDYANDVDYQEEAMSYGYNKNGKFQHSYAGLPRVPENGAYIYRTNPNPETDPWVITGAMKVNRLLTPSEVDEMVIAAGRTPQLRQEGAVTDADVGQFNEENGLADTSFRVVPSTPSTTIVNGEAKGIRESFDDMVKRASYQMKEAGYDRYQSIKEFMRMASKAHGVNLKNDDVKEIVSYENPYIALLNKSSINEKEVKAWEKKYYIPIIDAIQRIYKDGKGKIAQLQQYFGSESMDDILNNYTQGKHGLERNRDMAVRKSLDDMAKATVITKQEAEDMLETVNADLRNDVITPTQADARRLQINNMLTTKKYDEKMVKHQTERWDEIKDEIRKDDKLTWEQKQRALDKAAITEFGVDLAERDYSGLGEVFPNKGGKLQESIEAAYKAVVAFEEAFDTADLWKAIKAANDATLEKAFMSSIINRETYNNIRNMYDYYIPLRGFEAKTTEDVYGYLNNEPKAFSMPVKRANGRASKAEFAIPHILQMAHSAILQGNNNLAKLTMANFAQHYPSDLVKQSNMWIEYDETSKTWVAKYPDIPKDASVEDVSRIVDDFNANMEELAKDNPKKYRKVKGKMDVPYIVPKDKVHYHQIPYKRNGVDYILTVSGSPRLAFVMNGEIDKAPSVMGEVGEKVEGITRFLSGMYTQYNPDFMVSNFFRDGSFVLSTVPVREDAKYAANYYKNYFLNNPLVMTRLFNKYEAGTLNRDNYIEAAFEDFLKHGGETGYAILRDVEETKRKVKKDIHYGLWNKAKALIDRLGIVGRGVESSARFAAYLTSREAGRSIARSVYDAKEVSVNFNRKGAGAVFNNLADQNFWGKMVGNTAGVFKITHAFFNAGVQGLAGVSKLVKHNPVKGGMWLASPFLLGVLIASLYDDDDEYYNLTETVRRQNIMIRMGDDYVSIPLAIELRALYGIGEMMVSLTRGKEDLTQKDVAYKIAEQILQAFPINVLEGNGGFDALMPTAYAMVQELMVNEDWQGIPIYREDKYAGEEYKPEWRMVNNYTDERLVAASKFLSKVTGGDYGARGGVEINPAVVQHIMEGMFGGPVSFANKVLAQYDVLVGDKEFEWRNVPFLNRLVKDGGGKAQERMLNREYRNNEERYEQIHSQEVDYQKFIKDASNSEEERAEYQRKLDELRASEEYKMLNNFHKQSLNIDKMYKAYKDQGILDEQMPTILEQKEMANAPLR